MRRQGLKRIWAIYHATHEVIINVPVAYVPPKIWYDIGYEKGQETNMGWKSTSMKGIARQLLGNKCSGYLLLSKI